MAQAILLPKLSDTMTVGVLASWVVKVGDTVSAGDVLCEIETDKATMEYESPFDGTVLFIGAEPGSEVQIGAVIAVLGKPGEDFQALLGGNAAAPAAQPSAANGTAAPASATPPVTAVAATVATAPVASAPTEGTDRLKASPLARTMAAELGVNLSAIPGSGDGGRIVRRDVEAAAAGGPAAAQPVAATPSAAVASATTAPTPVGGYTDHPVSQMRAVIARRLGESKFTAPHFYLTVSVDMDAAIAFRTQVNDDLAKQAAKDAKPEKVSFNDIVIKAVATALRKHPAVNSSWLGNVIRTYDYVNVGVAVAVDEGLLVPVLRNTDTLGLGEIGAKVRDYAARARDKKLKPDEMTGNTFTISNLGMFGIEEFTAIINPPDACILAVGAIQQVPVVKNGEVVPGNVMKLTLSCDHRVVDGAVGSAFLATLTRLLENPVRMLV